MTGQLTPRQEKFCIKYLETGYVAQAARAAGYSPRWPGQLGKRAMKLPAVVARLSELRKRAEDDAVMKAVERKRKLSEIARGRITDYLDESGKSFVVNTESVNAGAVSEVCVRTRPGRDGESAEMIVELKLHDPIRAIDMLNKMEGLYSDRDYVNAPIASIVEVVMARPAQLPEGDG